MSNKKSGYTHYEQTIIDSITLEEYIETVPTELLDKIKEVYKIFKSEYVHENNKKYPEVNLFKEWLQGLPSVLTVPFYNSEILENGKKAGYSIAGERSEDNFLNLYFARCSEAFFTLLNNL